MNPLNAQQQELVVRHMGLVRMHVRRQLRRLSAKTAQREREDMHQEGMLALMEAARRYCPQRCGPFAAYALPYVHGAICRHLMSQIDAMGGRRRGAARRQIADGDPDATHLHSTVPSPRFYELGDSQYTLARQAHRQYQLEQTAGRLHRPDRTSQPQPATLRRRYERAVRWAGEQLKVTRSCRPDRAALVEAILQERLLVPDPQYRSAIRAMARRFACSPGRIIKCERRLIMLIHRRLDGEQLRSMSTTEVFGRSAGTGPALGTSRPAMTVGNRRMVPPIMLLH